MFAVLAGSWGRPPERGGGEAPLPTDAPGGAPGGVSTEDTGAPGAPVRGLRREGVGKRLFRQHAPGGAPGGVSWGHPGGESPGQSLGGLRRTEGEVGRGNRGATGGRGG